MIISCGLLIIPMLSLGIFGSIRCEPVFAVRRRITALRVHLQSIIVSELPRARFGRLPGKRPPEGGRYKVAATPHGASSAPKARLLVLWQNRSLQERIYGPQNHARSRTPRESAENWEKARSGSCCLQSRRTRARAH